VEPSDIAQGRLGDCWLLSAIACLAEVPGDIERLFDQVQMNPRGQYSVRLFDKIQGKMVKVTVDDFIPVDKSKGQNATDSPVPLFSSPAHGSHELWVLILEKAFAKFCGSYAALEGGMPLWALEAMTGDKCVEYSISQQDQTWQPMHLKHDPTPKNKRRCVMSWNKATDQPLSPEQMFKELMSMESKGYLLAAGSKGVDETLERGRRGINREGIVPGHAYSILKVAHPITAGMERVRLVCVRNPWGSFEWKGDWSDKSEKWGQYPLIRAQIWPDTSNDDDGIFWMEWSDFIQHFDSIQVCMKSQGLHDLAFESHEENGIFGPCIGCFCGCLKYWLLCQGPYKLWCAKDNRQRELSSMNMV